MSHLASKSLILSFKELKSHNYLKNPCTATGPVAYGLQRCVRQVADMPPVPHNGLIVFMALSGFDIMRFNYLSAAILRKE